MTVEEAAEKAQRQAKAQIKALEREIDSGSGSVWYSTTDPYSVYYEIKAEWEQYYRWNKWLSNATCQIYDQLYAETHAKD